MQIKTNNTTYLRSFIKGTAACFLLRVSTLLRKASNSSSVESFFLSCSCCSSSAIRFFKISSVDDMALLGNRKRERVLVVQSLGENAKWQKHAICETWDRSPVVFSPPEQKPSRSTRVAGHFCSLVQRFRRAQSGSDEQVQQIRHSTVIKFKNGEPNGGLSLS